MSKTRDVDLLVVSAHAADFVWRAGGLIAKYSKLGRSAEVIALTFGERGESDDLWKHGKNVDEVKRVRRREALAAAKVLSAPVMFLDWGDYPIVISKEREIELAQLLRQANPEVIMTHSKEDLFNFDHETAAKYRASSQVKSV